MVAIEVAEEISCEDVFLGALGQDLALFEEEDVAKVGGDFFGMVGDEDDGRGGFQLTDVVEVLEETLSSQQVQADGGFIQDEELRAFHETAGDEEELALALREAGVGAADQVGTIDTGQHVNGLIELLLTILPVEDGGLVFAGQDDLLGQEVCGKALG